MSQPNDKPRTATPGNVKMLGELHATLSRKIEETMQPGFYGSVAVELTITDGNVRKITSSVSESKQQ